MENSILKIVKHSVCLSAVFMLTACASTETAVPVAEQSDLEILDGNGDGQINPYEALDVLLSFQSEGGKGFSIEDLQQIAHEREQAAMEEASQMLAELDADQDGSVTLQEIDEQQMPPFFLEADTNGDEIISVDEMSSLWNEADILSSEEDIQEQLGGIFEELDTDRDGVIALASEVPEERMGSIQEYDRNRDQLVTQKEVYAYMKADNTPVTFDVQGDVAYMSGVITSALPATVLELLIEHPEVKTIEMLIVPGSIDDVANLRAGLYVHKFGITTKLNSYSSVASGGTDFFTAGRQRIAEKGATIGVHSWGGGAVPATEVPRTDPVHQKYLDFYNAVGIPEEFYWYTLEAAPAEDIHIMTEDEITKYNIRTAK